MYITAQGCRLRNDLYCVEWDVKLYYTILVGARQNADGEAMGRLRAVQQGSRRPGDVQLGPAARVDPRHAAADQLRPAGSAHGHQLRLPTPPARVRHDARRTLLPEEAGESAAMLSQLISRFLSRTCTEVSGVENIGQCGRLSLLSWLLGAL